MRCSQVRRALIMEEVVGYGDPDDAPLRRHLGHCHVCREEADLLAAEVRLLRAAYGDLPLRPGFTMAVLELIARS